MYKVINMAHDVFPILLSVNTNSPELIGYHIEQSTTAEGRNLFAWCSRIGKAAPCGLVADLLSVRFHDDAMGRLKGSFTVVASLSMPSFAAAINELSKHC